MTSSSSLIFPSLLLLPQVLSAVVVQINASVMELTHSHVNGAHHLNRLFPEDVNILTHAKQY